MKSREISNRLHQYPYFRPMIVVHGTSAIIDAAVTTTLASSALFNINVDDARLSIVLSLLGTMVPFILLAPSASLFVEKLKFQRMTVAIVINVLRVVGLFVMASASSHSSTTRLAIFPIAFIMLTLSKCYVVAKTSALPQLTTVESFSYFSSRLSMTTGVVSVIAAPFFLAINNRLSESVALYVAGFLMAIGVTVSAFSYGRAYKRKKFDAAREQLTDQEATEVRQHEAAQKAFSVKEIARIIKSLFTYSAAVRFISGLTTIGIGLAFRENKFFLALCFLTVALASFCTNIIAVRLTRFRVSGAANYIILAATAICLAGLVSVTSKVYIVIVAAILGALSSYARVIYETKISTVVPSEFSARILSRGEAWMQSAWVLGALVAVATFTLGAVGIFGALAAILAGWAYVSTASVIHRH